MRSQLLASLAASAALVVLQVAACGGGGAGGAGSSGSSGGSGASGSGGASGSSGGTRDDAGSTFPDGSVAPTATCKAAGGTAKVQAPTFVRNIKSGETGWFSSPALVDLDGDGKKEIVAPFYSTFVFDASGKQLGKGTQTKGRVYAPAVVADLDKDGAVDVVVGGNSGTVAAYTFQGGKLAPKWTASTDSGGDSPEARGMAASDLDGDGKIEVVVTTTNTATTGAQVFVFDSAGKVYQPAGTAWAAWPRYNTATGAGGDKDWNGQGNQGY